MIKRRKSVLESGRQKGTWKCGIGFTLAAAMLVNSVASYGFTSYATSVETTTTEAATTESAEDTALDQARKDAAIAARNKLEAQEILDKLKKTRSDIEDYIIELDKSLNEIQIEISHLEQNQKELQETIKETQKQLKLAKTAQETQYEAMKERIQMVYESGDKSYLDVLLTATSMSDMLNKAEYASQVSLYDYRVLKQLKTAKEQVANLNQKLDKDMASNEALQAEVNAQKETMELLVEEKSAQIEEYDQSIAGQQAEVNKYAQAQAEAESIIVAAEQTASNSYTSTYTGGIFTWPVPGYSQVTSEFGNRTAPTAGASTNHKGIDIACDTGASIVAAAAGTVIVSTYNTAEGNYVCIDHGGGVVTVYMHNSQLLVNVGEVVTTGQVIALAGSTGYSTGPHCHFGVRVNGTYVDPRTYLQ